METVDFLFEVDCIYKDCTGNNCTDFYFTTGISKEEAINKIIAFVNKQGWDLYMPIYTAILYASSSVDNSIPIYVE